MIRVFLGLSGLNLEKCQTGQKQADLGKAIQPLGGNSLNFLTTQEGLWGTHYLEGFGRHL